MIKKAIITFIIATLIWILFICSVIVSKVEAKEVKQNTQKTKVEIKTSKDYKIQEQNFAMCVQSGKSRSVCQYLYR